MKLLQKTIAAITVPDAALARRVTAALCTRSGIHFGQLGDALARYIALTGERHPAPPQTSVVISCADHGVAAESVSAYPPETTLNMMCNYLMARGGAANAVANYVPARLCVADLGVNADTAEIPDLLHRSIARGTENMTKGAAMTHAQAIQAIETGIGLAADCAARGDRCILPGEMGISNTTSSAAITAAILRLTPEEVTGRGANISDERLHHKVEIVRRALAVNQPNPQDGIDVLAKVGGFELGCIAGIILGAAAHRILVVLDGANTTSAALIAHAIAPNCVHALLASHASLTEHSQPHALRHLGLTPMLRLDIRLSEAAGSSIALRMLELMLRAWAATDASSRCCAPFLLPPYRTLPSSSATGENTYDIPAPNRTVMDAAQYRLDNLAKPIHSLGFLEHIAVQLAGITGKIRLPSNSRAALCLLSGGEELPAERHAIISSMTAARDIDVYLLPAAIDRAERHAAVHAVAADHPLLILGSMGSDAPAVRTALCAAAEGGALVLPGDAATDHIVREYCVISPALTHYVLHLLPEMITAEIDAPAGIVGILGLEIVRAALHIMNDMKTFTEAKVAVAIDGAGAGRQVRER